MSATCLSKFQKFLKLPTNSIWDLFMRKPVKQIAYKYCVNFAKTEFPCTISLRCKYSKIHSRSNFPDAINGIGPTLLAGIERLQAHDVSLL